MKLKIKIKEIMRPAGEPDRAGASHNITGAGLEETGESPNQDSDMNDDGVLSASELEYHFDLDQDGEVTPDEYEDHVKWHAQHPEVLEIDEEKLGEKKPCWSGYEQIGMKTKDGKEVPNCVPIEEMSNATLENGIPVCEACLYETIQETKNTLTEAEYQGRNVPLGKPMKGDVKKFKVYVRDPKTGNVKKVNFGDKKMRIKKSNPARRKSFRARHNCANPGPRTKARYWSCRKW